MTIHEEDIQAYLYTYVEQTSWQIETPQRGFSFGKRFIAIAPDRKVFVRLRIDPRIIQFLSDARITPRYLAGGGFFDTCIAVQEYIEAVHPDRKWYAANMPTWAHMTKKLHSSSELRQYLPPVENETYRTLLAHYIHELKEEYQHVVTGRRERDVIEALIAQYEERVPAIQGAGLVPTHGDPGADNMLIAPTNVYLIDWDSLHLSDPMRDVAQVLWWMYPRSLWDEMLDLFGIDLTDHQQRERFYLHMSTRALYVSLFFIQLGHEHWAEKFLRDAQLALEQQTPDTLLLS
ncbi:MAG: aminoglycoside phosphotransferase family protein [Chloroflexota bacterium]|nr:aminoglycoside phosphotransferase family protein [Chloroflexota bacterium]